MLEPVLVPVLVPEPVLRRRNLPLRGLQSVDFGVGGAGDRGAGAAD
jgi:hypothetical protein